MLEKRIEQLKLIEDRFKKLSSFEHLSFYKELKAIQNTIELKQSELNDFSHNLKHTFDKLNSKYYLQIREEGLFLYKQFSQLIRYSFKDKKFTLYGYEYNSIEELNEFIEITNYFQQEFLKNRDIFDKNYYLIFKNLNHINKFLDYKENEEHIKKNTYLKKYLKLKFKQYKKQNSLDETKKQKVYRFCFEKNHIHFENIWPSNQVITHCHSDHSYILINYDEEKTFKLELEFLPEIVSNKIDIDLFYNFVMTKQQIETF